MSSQTETFSESWHRVAGTRVTLRPSVVVRRVIFRGERWHVLSDPLSNQFFRARPGAWDFIARLDGKSTVEQAWRQSLEEHPDATPGQEDVIQLLAQLYHANLIRTDLAPDSLALFQRHHKRRQREIKSKLSTILFVRIPLLDPDAFLKRTLPVAGWFFSRFGALLWLVTVGFAVKVALENIPALSAQSANVLAPSNLPLLYVGMALIKLIHELGHGYACRKFGGEVHTFGVMLLVFTPMPFVDATSSWNFRSRWRRLVVAAAGMYVELFVAALATFLWAATGPGLVHGLAYNMMFIASVSTILFNANPLLRFDGYYILTDLIGMPNLHQRSKKLWRHLFERYLFGNRRSKANAESRREYAFLAVFGAVAWVYRIFLFASILLFVAGRFLLLGIILAVTGVFTWLILPVGKFIRYIASSPQLERTRPRAVLVTAALAAAIVGLLAVIPFPNSFSAPGIVHAREYGGVFAEAPGNLAEILAASGTTVAKGQPLVRLVNPELDFESAGARAQLEEARAEEQSALRDGAAVLTAIREQIAAIEQNLAELERRRGNLTVTAPVDGIWVAPALDRSHGLWVAQGTALGEVINPESFHLATVVSQEDAASLFNQTLRAPRVKIRGQSEYTIAVTSQNIIPGQRRTLPSAALGWLGGGDLLTAGDDSSGTRASEAFFELRADLAPHPEAQLYHGQSGKLRCKLPPEPALPRAVRAMRQLLQRRFGI